jgi:Domain of unknown function (DUF4907)
MIPMIRKYYVLPSILILFLIVFCFKNKRGDDKMLKVESVLFRASSGWGYNILVDKKIFIHQVFIPAIAGNKEFATKEEAMKTASLAIEKLKKGKLPVITISDLLALKITY